jgi:hypothetical protein
VARFSCPSEHEEIAGSRLRSRSVLRMSRSSALGLFGRPRPRVTNEHREGTRHRDDAPDNRFLPDGTQHGGGHIRDSVVRFWQAAALPGGRYDARAGPRWYRQPRAYELALRIAKRARLNIAMISGMALVGLKTMLAAASSIVSAISQIMPQPLSSRADASSHARTRGTDA